MKRGKGKAPSVFARQASGGPADWFGPPTAPGLGIREDVGRRIEVGDLKACPTCGGLIFWRRSDLVPICQTCHPCPDSNMERAIAAAAALGVLAIVGRTTSNDRRAAKGGRRKGGDNAEPNPFES